MAPNDILDKLRHEPFQPLRVHLSDGSSYDITEHGFAAVARTEMYIGVDPDESGVPRRSIYIDTPHITRIEPIANGSHPGANGQ